MPNTTRTFLAPGRVALLVAASALGTGCAGPASVASWLPRIHIFVRIQTPHSLSTSRERLSQSVWLGANADWQLQDDASASTGVTP